MNFTINGTTVRGDPETQWTSSMYSTMARADFGTSLAGVRSMALPFTFSMYDWSNVEKGTGMVCKECKHSLAMHSHQSCLNVKK
eukprot:5205895-Alexandrium_andersonii.AAC.1